MYTTLFPIYITPIRWSPHYPTQLPTNTNLHQLKTYKIQLVALYFLLYTFDFLPSTPKRNFVVPNNCLIPFRTATFI